MHKTLVLFFGLTVANAVTIIEENDWEHFKVQYSKSYAADEEHQFRMTTFLQNRNKIAEHNKLFNEGHVLFKMGLNEYSDMTTEEFAAIMNGHKPTDSFKSLKFKNATGKYHNKIHHYELPRSIDWRKKGAVTGVKNQGRCGSCWSFSAIGALEGQHFRKTGVLVSLSEQNLIDCSASYGNNGCNGGNIEQSFEYIKQNHGIDTEKSYPYKGRNDKCRYNRKNSGATDRGYVNIAPGNEKKLQDAIASIGPIAVAIDASHFSFQHYRSGIYYEPKCSPRALNHAVLVVGYGVDDHGHEYYIVKNSWDKSWGDGGYIKMARNRHNNCGIATDASYPLV
ncbi:procathepsin L-like [Sitodiplosis mosellana]|uniref:procathepsin L-like n=1 Tax=Sitodiplosis mosellana TaxID=263140 RepID=UPI0024440F1E|nr:procathepsin L-like [Sitodiplosis mosellana]